MFLFVEGILEYTCMALGFIFMKIFQMAKESSLDSLDDLFICFWFSLLYSVSCFSKISEGVEMAFLYIQLLTSFCCMILMPSGIITLILLMLPVFRLNFYVAWSLCEINFPTHFPYNSDQHAFLFDFTLPSLLTLLDCLFIFPLTCLLSMNPVSTRLLYATSMLIGIHFDIFLKMPLGIKSSIFLLPLKFLLRWK